jgi:hypothetical protein
MKKLHKLLVSGAFFALFHWGHALEVTSLYDFRVLGGQHFFEGKASSVAGNINILVAPTLKFNKTFSLIPAYLGEYRGTRDVQELAGGGTLFQDSTSHGVFVKGVYQVLSSLKVKPSLGARAEFLRETKDEAWGKGLFDYRKYSGGLEGEYDFTREMGTRLSYDYYFLDFVNYKSLESASDPTLSRELAGQDILNSRNHLGTWGFWYPLLGLVRGDFTVSHSLRDFPEQRVVILSGDLSQTRRQDKGLSGTLGFHNSPLALSPRMRLAGNLSLGYIMNESNQNHYDARKTFFIQDYYNYNQVSVSPQVVLAFKGQPWVVTLGGQWRERTYDERPIQDKEGNYLNPKLKVTEISSRLGLSWALSKYFKVRALTSMAWSDSNMEYEKVFRYNYKIVNYLVGFSYEY